MNAKLAMALEAKESLKKHYEPFGLVGIGLTKIQGQYAIKIDLHRSPDKPPPSHRGHTGVPVVFTYLSQLPELMGFIEDDE